MDRSRGREFGSISSFSESLVPMGKPRPDVSPGESVEKRRGRPKRERWLLTRKTWRYMADAGRKLIPEGLQNRPEDVPKIEAYFQEVCQKEPRFLLWRKHSYPGAIGFRNKGRSRGGRKKMGGSCRDKTSSADEAEDIKQCSANLTPHLTRKLRTRPDLKQLKEEFLLGSIGSVLPQPEALRAGIVSSPEEESELLLETLEMYLKERLTDPKVARSSKSALNYEELSSKLREHLASIERAATEERFRPVRTSSVNFEGDIMQKMLLETIRRHFGKSTNREKVISDLLTDRKSLEMLYFDLRKTRGFKSSTKSSESFVSGLNLGAYSAMRWKTSWRPSGTGSPLHCQDLREEEGSEEEEGTSSDSRQNFDGDYTPPLHTIEKGIERNAKENDYATQTESIPASVVEAIQDELKRIKLVKQQAEEQEAKEDQFKGKNYRRSSVTDNDDVSPSVGDTIKRYLRMARKKSIDSDRIDRFKRVNYDKNIRNIKPKGEISQISDDDGLDKGIQTDESWVVALKELKLVERPGEISPTCEGRSSSRVTSSRSSVDTGMDELYSPSQTRVSPLKSPSGILSSGQTFLSNLLHHQKPRNASSVSVVPGVMQKSKSSSSVVHQGSRLVAKKIWKSRSKSQNRVAASNSSTWTPQGNCQWTNGAGRTITLGEASLLQLSDVERRVLQKVAMAKLQALNLGVTIRIPSESAPARTVQKPKRRAYLLKRKAITTGFFDSKAGKDDKEKSDTGGLVFGVPLVQCVESERLVRGGKIGEECELRRKSHHGSRSSFSSLMDSPAKDEKGSSESLISPTLSMPGLLDTLSVDDLSQDQGGVPNIVTCCLRHLENHGLHTLGIFRVSSSKKRVRQLREDFDCGKEMAMEEDLCPHDVATLLKEYFRDLPDSLLCKDLYSAFVQTQRIRNRRLQHEALQHLIQLLPVPNRDTLWVLLTFLSQVAQNCDDHRKISGEWVVGNKMDSNNLATLFAPNILHACKPSSKDDLSAERTEERSDAINVVRALIDNHHNLFQVSAELLDEVYVHMMDSHPEVLDQLLQRKDLATEEIEELDVSILSDDRLAGSSHDSFTEERLDRKIWSREAFTHETAGMGGPDLDFKPRRERGRRRWREDGRKRQDSEQSTPSRRTSSTSIGSEDPAIFRGKPGDAGVITASIKIPVPQSSFNLNLDESDIPFIEDPERHNLGITRVSQHVSSESSQASTYVHQVNRDSAMSSSVSPPPLSVSSYSSGCVSSWGSTPPTSPDPTMFEEPVTAIARITIPTKKTPDYQQRMVVQRVSIKSAGEVRKVETITSESRRREHLDHLAKSASVTAVAVCAPERTGVTPSISSIGGAVLRSKTADIERMLKIQSASKQTKKTESVTMLSVTSEEDKKMRRKYSENRHLTRNLPQPTDMSGTGPVMEMTSQHHRVGAVYKRRELISSDPKERKVFPN